jgi:hypothetical protein
LGDHFRSVIDHTCHIGHTLRIDLIIPLGKEKETSWQQNINS